MIYYNAIQTPDGTIIESRNRHDFVTHVDANGKTYGVDGGTAYLRRIGHNRAEDCKELALYDTDPHEKIREVFRWGTYGKSGMDKFKTVVLKDMTDEHIKAIQYSYSYIAPLMTAELKWRETEQALKDINK